MSNLKSLINVLAIIYSFVLIEPSQAATKQPRGWGVQYQDASCIVSTETAGSEGDPPWRIKMGYLAGNQLIFLFSAYNTHLEKLEFPKNAKAWFVVDGKLFYSLGIFNQSGELVLPIENGLKLQKALASAKSLGIRVQMPESAKPIDAADFELANIPGAMEWLRTCSVIGVGALPH